MIRFDKFIGLDFQTTAIDATTIQKENKIGFQIAKCLIRGNTIHKPYNFENISTLKGKLEIIDDVLYLMADDGLYKYDGTTFTKLVDQDFGINYEMFKIVKMKTINNKIATITAGDEQEGQDYITTSGGLETNEYIQKIAVVNGTKYYITANDTDNLYIEGQIDTTITAGQTIDIYDTKDTLVLYNGQNLYIYDNNGITTILTDIPNSFIFNYYGRLVVVKPEQIIISTLDEATYFPKYNYINIGKTYDAIEINNNIRIFTDTGVYCLSGLGQNTFNMVRISDYKVTKRIYPVAYKGIVFANIDGKIQSFEDYPKNIYNYRLSPDVTNGLFKITEGLITKTNKLNEYVLLNFEESENTSILGITELLDINTIYDVKEYRGDIFITSEQGVFKQNGYGQIHIKTNKINLPAKVFLQNIVIDYEVDSMIINLNGNQYELNYNANNIQHIYPINKWGSEIEIEILSNNVIPSFILNF